ncbi:hypothetical protein V6N13_070868 [Hibiscus sabdariffa]|uniref:Transmembrane protein n=1 Tax=Hibiscus sabdariffa TaxID=183260 RepID=A0ABR2TF40_9ROSI
MLKPKSKWLIIPVCVSGKIMATKTLSPHPQPLYSFPFPSKFSTNQQPPMAMACPSFNPPQAPCCCSTLLAPNRGQAALLTFCTCISLASVALVLTITFPDVGNNWFWITVLSPLAGAHYRKRASRKEQIKVKMLVANDGTVSKVVVQGDDQQVYQMRKELELSEKGMVYVKGLFER